ncbi:MAG: ABC transporter permease, partial [Saprospiraceae bacterium]
MMIAEIFLSFIVLFGVLTFGVDNYKQFSSPNGFSVENLLEVALEWETTVDSATLHQQKSTLRQEILGMSNVGHVAYSLHNTPYSHSQWINGNDDDDGLKFETHYFNVDENFDEALDIKISEGRWFTDDDNTSKVLPVVINQKLKDELFPNESVIGKQIKISNEYKIIGIIENFKYEGIFAQEPNCSFINFPSITHATGNFMTHDCKLMVKLKEPISQKNEFAIYQKINSTVNNCVFTINSMENKKQETGKSTYMTLVVISTVSFFLIFNVALGIFGVLWSNINKRRPEIGLRRAMGATPIQIIGQILGETVF